MADVFRLANFGQTSTYDFLTAVLELQQRSWVTRGTTIGQGYRGLPFDPMNEVFGLVANDTAVNIRNAADAITEFIEAARLFEEDNSNDDSQWLEWSIDGEPTKRSLILAGALQIMQGVGVSPFLEDTAALAKLSIIRHPFWENISASTALSLNVSCLGGKVDFNSVLGTAPARMSAASFYGKDGGVAADITRVWCGIREELEGTANFESVWELEDGTNSTDATDTVDATASSGNKVRIDFGGTTSMTKRLAINLDDVYAGNYDDHIGSYLVLCRCAVTADEAGVKMKVGYAPDSGTDPVVLIESETVYVDDTDWRLIELGTVQLPLEGHFQGKTGADVRKFQVQVHAEQSDGSPTLDLDCIIFIPNRHFVYFDGANIRYDGGDTKDTIVYTTENERRATISYRGGFFYSPNPFSTTDWYMPKGNSLLVLAAERTSSHVKDDIINLSFDYYPRWHLYRSTAGT